MRWNVADAVFRPNIITSATKTLHSVRNAVFSLSSECTYLVIVAKPVEKTVALMACYRVENVVREWERETIRDRGRVEFPIVYTDSYFPVLLRNDYYRAQLGGALDWPNEADAE